MSMQKLSEKTRRSTFRIVGGMIAGCSCVTRSRAATPWDDWKDLLNYLPVAGDLNAKRQARGRNVVNMTIQKIEDASGDLINFDKYIVEISRMPTSGFTTAGALFLHMRRNMSSFFDPTASSLEPFEDHDRVDWGASGPAPIGSVMVFKIPAWRIFHEKAGVVTSQSSDQKWVFTPAKVDSFSPGEHPVSGNREFGYLNATGGKVHFYTRAADRVLATVVPGQTEVFKGAERLWASWQARVVAYVNSNGGAAAALSPTQLKPKWTDVKQSGLFAR